MEILIATKNAYKVDEMKYLLKDISGIETVFLRDSGIDIDVEEEEDTLEGNARNKAKEISKYTDAYVFASDNGVDIPGLKDKWDVLRNRRIVGYDNSELEKANKLLSLMKGLTGEDRRCENHLAVAIGYKGEVLWSYEGVTDRGYILEELIDEDIPQDKWMGHLWYYPEFKKVANYLTNEERVLVRENSFDLKSATREFIISLMQK